MGGVLELIFKRVPTWIFPFKSCSFGDDVMFLVILGFWVFSGISLTVIAGWLARDGAPAGFDSGTDSNESMRFREMKGEISQSIGSFLGPTLA